ncbi:MAG: hypothetical protein JW784_01635, partial [Candidatus Cloacimonetes bacterium]|nr:hypothetical protein [Candidatus Cloacimonadota bacterium]
MKRKESYNSFFLNIFKPVILVFMVLSYSMLAAEGTLFVGLEGSTLPTYYSDLSGFPDINWTSSFPFDVSGAAASDEGMIYLCAGAFTTHLYQATLTSPPQQLCTVGVDLSALAWANGVLYGYSNYADPKGIYSIEPLSGNATLVLDVHTNYGYRFFALDYNPEDGLFYGYTEYGTSGLYSIDIISGEMIYLTGSIPASNGQGRGMAVGNNTVYLTATRGDDGIPYFAYDLAQGAGGNWVEFPNPYPEHHSTGGAAWIPSPDQDIQISGQVVGSDHPETGLAYCDVILLGDNIYQTQTDENGEFILSEVIGNSIYFLEISQTGYGDYFSEIQTTMTDLDLGQIQLTEIPYPVDNVIAIVNEQNTEVLLSWDVPVSGRDLEFFKIYRFPAANSGEPALWDLLDAFWQDIWFTDTEWAGLEQGIFQYAVVAVYSNEVEAEAVLSNEVEQTGVNAD